MATSNSNGSLTATGGEDNIQTITTSGSFVLTIDTNAMALGDEIVIRVKHKVRSVGTTRLYDEVVYAHNQDRQVKISIPAPSTNEVVFTLEQTAGTNRTYPWEILEL